MLRLKPTRITLHATELEKALAALSRARNHENQSNAHEEYDGTTSSAHSPDYPQAVRVGLSSAIPDRVPRRTLVHSEGVNLHPITHVATFC